ncbi:hypothetical protein GCM10023107_01660 [Actinoplanes octamycinicus]
MCGVSEETGSISIAENGKLTRNLTDTEFREMLEGIFLPEQKQNDDDAEETLIAKITALILAIVIWFLISGEIESFSFQNREGSEEVEPAE